MKKGGRKGGRKEKRKGGRKQASKEKREKSKEVEKEEKEGWIRKVKRIGVRTCKCERFTYEMRNRRPFNESI